MLACQAPASGSGACYNHQERQPVAFWPTFNALLVTTRNAAAYTHMPVCAGA